MAKKTHKIKGNPDILNQPELCRAFLRAMRSRESILPKTVLMNRVDAVLERRDLFLEGASRFGTPQYFYDEPSVIRQIERFKEVFSRYFDSFHMFYAMKSNSFAGIRDQVVMRGMGLDVSSGLELTKALSSNCKKIIFTGPGKTDEEIQLAVRNRDRVTVLVDSHSELQRISELLQPKINENEPVKVGFRVRSNQGGIWDKFGIPLNNLSDTIWKASSFKGIEPCGIQFHTSWNLDPARQIMMINEIGSYINRNLPETLQKSLKFFDIGGGFWPEEGEWLNPQNTAKGKLIELLDPVYKFSKKHYYHKSKPLDYFAKEIFKTLQEQGPPICNLDIWMEPGRWISTPTMHILLKVIDKKDQRVVITDGGTNLLGWEKPLAEFTPVINLSRPSNKECSVRVFGSLCTPHDIWGHSIFGNGVERGDFLIVPDQGAYTYSLRQSFIKPVAKVVRYDGNSLDETEAEKSFP
ncbi:MAG: diaminopimelate decarboxylase family protein [Candidatus Heimdallarchaeota archaeon]